jgi:hypothetical protein
MAETFTTAKGFPLVRKWILFDGVEFLSGMMMDGGDGSTTSW